MNRLDLPDVCTRDLIAIAALAEHRSFVRAAKLLRVTQPRLTRAVQKLEREFGVLLFDRNTRRVLMTPAGREFVVLAHRMLNELKVVPVGCRGDAPCCHSLANANPATLEWFIDTARSIMSLIAENAGARTGGGGVLGRGRAAGPPPGGGGGAPITEPSAATRYNNVKFIWSHAGGTLLGAVSRVVGGVDAQSLAGTPAVNSRLYHVRRFYYDTAGSANPIAMQGLKTLLGGTSHIVFGTDLP